MDRCLHRGSRVVCLSRGRPSPPLRGGSRRAPCPRGGAEPAHAVLPATAVRTPQSKTHLVPPGRYRRAPSSGFVLKDLPSIDVTSGASSHAPRAVARSRRASARGCRHRARSVLAVSHRLDGLRHPRFAGVLQPAADHGVHRVSAPHAPAVPAAALALPLQCPRPPERSPLRQPCPRHRGPMPPRRSPRSRAARPRGLAPPGSPLRRRVVADPPRPMLSWASPSSGARPSGRLPSRAGSLSQGRAPRRRTSESALAGLRRGGGTRPVTGCTTARRRCPRRLPTAAGDLPRPSARCGAPHRPPAPGDRGGGTRTSSTARPPRPLRAPPERDAADGCRRTRVAGLPAASAAPLGEGGRSGRPLVDPTPGAEAPGSGPRPEDPRPSPR
jgi:hypothetical protein